MAASLPASPGKDHHGPTHCPCPLVLRGLPCPHSWRGATFPDNPPTSGALCPSQLRSWLPVLFGEWDKISGLPGQEPQERPDLLLPPSPPAGCTGALPHAVTSIRVGGREMGHLGKPLGIYKAKKK